MLRLPFTISWLGGLKEAMYSEATLRGSTLKNDWRRSWRIQRQKGALFCQVKNLTASPCTDNKQNAKFSGILESVPGVFEAHPRFKRLRGAEGPGEWQFDMTSREDEGRQVRVHVFVFNLFVA